MKTTMVIADDHELLREALSGHSARHAGFDVVASVGDAQAAVNACNRLKPDLLLLDIEMPGRDALSAIADVKAGSPSTKIVILTAYCRDIFIDVALHHGVSGYLLKTDSPTLIFEALAKVVAGTTVYSKSVQARLSQRDTRHTGGPPRSARLSGLTPRELEVLRYIGQGMDNEAMAEAMSLSKRTVERHVARLMDAVAIRERAGLMKFAYDQGFAG